MEARLSVMVFHVLIVFALVFGWSPVSAAEVSPVEISIPAMLNVAENYNTVQLCATLQVHIDFNLEFDSNGTGKTASSFLSVCEQCSCIPAATNGSDLMEVPTNLIIDASIITTRCIDITDVIDTFMLEEDESFTVALTTTNSNVGLGNDVTTVTITNDTEGTYVVHQGRRSWCGW